VSHLNQTPTPAVDPASFMPSSSFLPFNAIKELTFPQQMAYYAVHTCWWGFDTYYSISGNARGLPCDPRGSVLMQGPADKFIEAAEKNPDHYGEHKLLAFAAAFHGNVLTLTGKPTSFEGWVSYNILLNHWMKEGWKPE
jgi:hypothetical protein